MYKILYKSVERDQNRTPLVEIRLWPDWNQQTGYPWPEYGPVSAPTVTFRYETRNLFCRIDPTGDNPDAWAKEPDYYRQAVEALAAAG